MALLHVVQQVLQAPADALALGVYGFLQCLGIECQKIARRAGGRQLLDGKADAGAGFFIGIDRLSHLGQHPGVEQIKLGGKSSQRVGRPGRVGKATVIDFGRTLQGVGP
ncbi:hypothetical protein GALL_468020 [mine drainage metagenome]|uniref:Uncharacterized protein n=1 Tax=mine drainage metagenome TaxID=410659 RepID=A0A1J5Q277_9ZZZZ